MPRLALKKNLNIAFLLLIILAISVGLNFYGNSFPLGYHPDEVTKVYFIQNNTQDFRHPILILQVVRVANSLFKFQSEQQIAVLGRISTGFFGTLIVFLTYKIARQRLSERYALGTGLLTAVSPGIVMHSHYLKEDIAFTFAVLLSFLCFFDFANQLIEVESEYGQKLTKARNKIKILWLQILLLGLATGLIFSSKYNSIIIVLLYLITPVYTLRLRTFSYFKGLFLSFVIALMTFLLINYPLFFHFNTFVGGFKYELKHAVIGHFGLLIHPMDQLFAFHLKYSIFPSLTILPVMLALCFMIFCLVQWKAIDWQERFLITYVLLFYATVEISPLKPFPGFIRYVVPLIPVLSYFGIQAIRLAINFIPAQLSFLISLALITVVIFFPILDSIKLDYYLNQDTREQVDLMLATKQNSKIYESYVKPFVYPPVLTTLTDLNLEGKGQDMCTLVASSFMYDRYFFAGKMKNQSTEVYTKHQQYLKLFNYPYTEIAPAYKSFAFSNPTIRVIDLCQEKST